MKASVSLQDQKLKLLETFMKINDRKVIEKLYKLLIKEDGESKSESVITEELRAELDDRWHKYKTENEATYSAEQVKSYARKKYNSKIKK